MLCFGGSAMQFREMSVDKAVRIYSHFRALRAIAGVSGVIAIMISFFLIASLPIGVFVEKMPMPPVLILAWLAALILGPCIGFLSMLTPLVHKHILMIICLFFGVSMTVLYPMLFAFRIIVGILTPSTGQFAFDLGILVLAAGIMLPHFVMSLYLTRLGWALARSSRETFAVGRGQVPRLSSIFSMFFWAAGVPSYVMRRAGRWKVSGLLVLSLVLSVIPAYIATQAQNLLFPLTTTMQLQCQSNAIPAQYLFTVVNLQATPCLKVTFDWVMLAAAGIIIATVFAWVVVRPVARVFSRMARRVMVQTYDEARKSDQRLPVLFLRAFADDHRVLKQNPASTLERFFTLTGEPGTQDEIILDSASPYGPVVAIGDPDDPIPPFGAARTFVGSGDWQAVVSQLMTESHSVIISIDESPGLAWEIEEIVRQGSIRKTLFLFGPELDAQLRQDGAAMLARLMGEHGYVPDIPHNQNIVGAYLDNNNIMVILTTQKLGANAYITVCRWFFLDKFGYASETMRAPRIRPNFATAY